MHEIVATRLFLHSNEIFGNILIQHQDMTHLSLTHWCQQFFERLKNMHLKPLNPSKSDIFRTHADVKMVWEAQHSTHSFIVMLQKIFKNNFCLLSDINHTYQIFHRSYFLPYGQISLKSMKGFFELSENVQNVTISKATLETDP